jgi:iron(III) transport system ATP-binding protein
MAEPLIVTRDLAKEYRMESYSVTALHGVSLDIAAGEFVAVMGPSGSGKSTLFRALAGIWPFASGDVQVPGGKEVMLVPQRPYLPTGSLRAALAYPGIETQYPDAEIVDALKTVGLGQLAESLDVNDNWAQRLSGGEQQRVALARAILPRPAVMLMDEPFSGLDVQLRERLQEETLQLLRETRATCLIVTHAPAEAIRLGDRIAVMRGGRLVQAGKAVELYRNPADLFVARLFSEINEIPLRVDGGALRTPIGTFVVPDLADGDEAILCIRRRAIRVQAAGQGLPGRVLHVKFLGDQAVLEVAAQGFERPLLTLVREGEEPPRGAEVGLVVEPESVLVFPAEAPRGGETNVIPTLAETS